jgi:hypothetical protein
MDKQQLRRVKCPAWGKGKKDGDVDLHSAVLGGRHSPVAEVEGCAREAFWELMGQWQWKAL